MSNTRKNKLLNSNINYVGKDFNELKTSLIRYSKSYFPDSYRDFNETSTGMMLLELSAYVGDVLNFYVDQQYKEMLLPLAEERKSIINLARSYGYKVKAIAPSYVTVTVKQEVDAEGGNPNFVNAAIIEKGMKVGSNLRSSLIFETLDIVDFQTSSSADLPPEATEIEPITGVPNKFMLTRKVRAVSGETTTTSFNVGAGKKFLKLTLPETNVIEILNVKDSNSNIWYQVDYLAQDKVPVETHYTSDNNRTDAYSNLGSSTIYKLPIPYSLKYNKVSKKFMVEVASDGKTSLIFGNGVLRSGQSFESLMLALNQAGIDLPGSEENLNSSINPLLGDSYGTLGEAPAHITLTVKYRIGGGISSNAPTGDLTKIDTISTLAGTSWDGVTVTNEVPAAGGSAGETLEEVRHRAIGDHSTQNRCVTKEDFEARTLNMSAKFGNISKVYCARSGAVRNAQREKLQNLVTRLKDVIDLNYKVNEPNLDIKIKEERLNQIRKKLDADQDGGLTSDDFKILEETLEMAYSNISQDDRLYTIDLYLLSYDNSKNLINTPNIVKQNLKQYLDQYRMITDQITFFDGYVINFGVVFDVVSQKTENKNFVKLRCIEEIKKHFLSNEQQFKEIIYTSEIENLLMGVEGVRSVNYVTLTQGTDYNTTKESGGDIVFYPGLYNTLISSDNTTSSGNNPGYGYFYDFAPFYGPNSIAGDGVILPAYEPSVFELKNPNKNIKGIVR
tara:strand:- start:622 stop:2808 length:2187 start_codon:yes stop_codon:yes gene_type:complete